MASLSLVALTLSFAALSGGCASETAASDAAAGDENEADFAQEIKSKTDAQVQAEIEAALGDVNRALDQAQEAVDLAGISTVVGLAGSVTTVTAYALGLRSYDPSAIHLADLSVAEHQRAAAHLLGMARGDRASLGFMHPGRVDVIGAGALIWSEVLARVQASSPNVRVVTSEHDILDGIALSLRD